VTWHGFPAIEPREWEDYQVEFIDCIEGTDPSDVESLKSHGQLLKELRREATE
jgi:hypothetical protein